MRRPGSLARRDVLAGGRVAGRGGGARAARLPGSSFCSCAVGSRWWWPTARSRGTSSSRPGCPCWFARRTAPTARTAHTPGRPSSSSATPSIPSTGRHERGRKAAAPKSAVTILGRRELHPPGPPPRLARRGEREPRRMRLLSRSPFLAGRGRGPGGRSSLRGRRPGGRSLAGLTSRCRPPVLENHARRFRRSPSRRCGASRRTPSPTPVAGST